MHRPFRHRRASWVPECPETEQVVLNPHCDDTDDLHGLQAFRFHPYPGSHARYAGGVSNPRRDGTHVTECSSLEVLASTATVKAVQPKPSGLVPRLPRRQILFFATTSRSYHFQSTEYFTSIGPYSGTLFHTRLSLPFGRRRESTIL